MQTILITGASSGIGRALAMIAAQHQHKLIVLVRQDSDIAPLKQEISAATPNNSLYGYACDLASQGEINRVCSTIRAEHQAIDILVNNAAIYTETRKETADKIEMNLAVNVLAPLLLIQNLLPMLQAGHNACVYNISSIGEQYGAVDFNDLMSREHYSGNAVYNNSKLLLTLLTYELAERHKMNNIRFNCIHPGATATSLVGDKDVARMPFLLRLVFNIVKHFRQTPERAARTIYNTITNKRNEALTGKFFINGNVVASSPQSQDKRLMARAWEVCTQLNTQTPTYAL